MNQKVDFFAAILWSRLEKRLSSPSSAFFISYFPLQFFPCPTFYHPHSSFLLFVEGIRCSIPYPLIPFSNMWFSPSIVAIVPFHRLFIILFVIFFFVTATLSLFIFFRRLLHCLSCIRGYSDEYWVLVSIVIFSFTLLVTSSFFSFFIVYFFFSFFGHFFSRFLSFINLTLFFRPFYDSFSLQALMRLGNDKSRM